MPKTDEGISEAIAKPSDDTGVALVTGTETGNEKEEGVIAADGEERVQKSVVNSESSFAVSVMKAEEVGLKEIASSSSTTEQSKALSSSGITAPCSNINETNTEVPLVTEKAAASDKEKLVNKSPEDVPTGSTNPPAVTRQEVPPRIPTEVRKSPLIPRYSRFDFLANSMIITDVTTERGTVTVKECSAYEGFYGPEPERPS